MQTCSYQTDSVEETYRFGSALGECLQANDVLALQGYLGAGKTTLTHGIAKGLGINSPVSSPTFTLLYEHPAGGKNLSLYHFDAYRLEDEWEWYDAGFMEYLNNDGVSIIEWADKIQNVLPKHSIWLKIKKNKQKLNSRVFTLKVPDGIKFDWQHLSDWSL